MLLVLKLYPILIVISFPLWIKFTFCSFFTYVWGVLVTNLFHCYWLKYFGYSVNYNTRGAFMIIFLICSNLMNCLRSVGTRAITTESGWNSLKVVFTKQFITKATIFWCFINRTRSVFPDYLSVSYDYGKITFREILKLYGEFWKLSFRVSLDVS